MSGSSVAGFRAIPRFTLGLRLCDDKSAFVFPVCDFNLILTDLKSANCCRAYMTCLARYVILVECMRAYPFEGWLSLFRTLEFVCCDQQQRIDKRYRIEPRDVVGQGLDHVSLRLLLKGLPNSGSGLHEGIVGRWPNCVCQDWGTKPKRLDTEPVRNWSSGDFLLRRN
ncbi:hypothetical protein F2Q70_00004366 [Brassica cretica]|uniref:Uncharacterized protein n=1 Tax=Brassica cretica TaxID=69181 RepID=A0A8S9IZ22_BRACR|nr:hypothetical protein F2Q70_00004366 [Brassica cretica]